MGVLKFEQVIEFEVTHCKSCQVVVVMPSSMMRARREDRKTFFCLNGHSLSFRGETEAEKLTKQLASEREAKVTRIKNRVGNGVCPCCNRTFQNLQRHMHTKHPEYRSDEPKE